MLFKLFSYKSARRARKHANTREETRNACDKQLTTDWFTANHISVKVNGAQFSSQPQNWLLFLPSLCLNIWGGGGGGGDPRLVFLFFV